MKALWIRPEEFNFARFIRRKLVGPLRAHVLVKYFPYWKEYRVAQVKRIRETFSEITEHARAYGRKKGRRIEVTGNFAFLLPPYFPLVEHVDFITLELGFGIPPKSKHALFYKLGRSIDSPLGQLRSQTEEKAGEHLAENVRV